MRQKQLITLFYISQGRKQIKTKFNLIVVETTYDSVLQWRKQLIAKINNIVIRIILVALKM